MLSLAEAQLVAEKLKTSFADVVINGSKDHPIVVARGHNREWAPQRILHARYGKHAQVVLTNPAPSVL